MFSLITTRNHYSLLSYGIFRFYLSLANDHSQLLMSLLVIKFFPLPAGGGCGHFNCCYQDFAKNTQKPFTHQCCECVWRSEKLRVSPLQCPIDNWTMKSTLFRYFCSQIFGFLFVQLIGESFSSSSFFARNLLCLHSKSSSFSLLGAAGIWRYSRTVAGVASTN